MNETLTQENLKLALEGIGYSIRNSIPNQFIFNHKNENTGINVFEDTMYLASESGIKTIMVFEECKIRTTKNSVIFGGNGIFLSLYNFTIN